MLRVMSLLATLVLVAAVLTLFFGHALVATNPIGLAIQGLAIALMIWARVTFGLRSFHAAANPTEGGIVTHGPYRFWRHPIYASILYFFWAAIASHPAWWTITAGIVATLAVAIRIASEERLLVERYPEYRAYAARTKRVVPFVI
jgi:protein-S-isoprenylcysteine O-methyltransferase Ste14